MSLAEALLDLQDLTRRLRRECPWDREQTAVTIVPHGRGGLRGRRRGACRRHRGASGRARRSPLPGLLSVAAPREKGAGDLESVARDVHAKLVRRHPHVFGDVEARTPGRVRERWEALKTSRRRGEGIFHDVPEALPALLRVGKSSGGRLPWIRLARSRRSLRKAAGGARGARGSEHSGRCAHRRPSPTPRSSTSSATCCSRSSTSLVG